MTRAAQARLIVPADVAGDILVAEEGLSFWGGVDPETGVVIDAHHPLHGQSLTAKVVLMPTSRGSCSGSGVLLQLALSGKGPAALVFRETEEILTLGALIARLMFSRAIGVVQLPEADYAILAGQTHAQLRGETLSCPDHQVALHRVSPDDLDLTTDDLAKLRGEQGQPVAMAMEVIVAMAAAQGARRLIDVMRGHIDGCIYAHDANLIFAEKMAGMGAQVAIPTTINAISVDRQRWDEHGLAPDFAQAACRLADAYVQMGARPTFTCAPYLLDDVPGRGEDIGWSESNAVIFANSVLGARTTKHPDYLDLFVAMTGRAPETGGYIETERRPQTIIKVDLPEPHDDAVWPLLGWVAGRLAPDRVPRLDGLAEAAPGRDDLRAMCAAFGTTSAAPMLHVAGVTPEANLAPMAGAATIRLGRADLAAAWAQFNAGPREVGLVALGSPHLTLEETRQFAELMDGKTVHAGTEVILTLGRACRDAAALEGLVDQLGATGVRVLSDLCWCSIVEPILPPQTQTVMTNSGKYAHYAPGLSGRDVRFGSLADCALAAQTGFAPAGPPDWLRTGP